MPPFSHSKANIFRTLTLLTCLAQTSITSQSVHSFCCKFQINIKTLSSCLTPDCGRSYSPNACAGKTSSLNKGNYLSQNEQPWISFLDSSFSNGSRIFCSGSIINHKFILTAAHCLKVENQSLDFVYVYVGVHNLSSMGQESRIYRSVSVILHEEYNEYTFENNIGLVKLPVPLDFVPSIRPVCLPRHREEKFDHQIATVSGWGEIQGNSALRSLLPKGVNLNITPPDYPGYHQGSLRRLSAKSEENRVCHLDEGGPLVLREEGKCTVVGITNPTSQCEVQNIVGEFTRVSEYTDWIIKHAVTGGCFIQATYYSRIFGMLHALLM